MSCSSPSILPTGCETSRKNCGLWYVHTYNYYRTQSKSPFENASLRRFLGSFCHKKTACALAYHRTSAYIIYIYKYSSLALFCRGCPEEVRREKEKWRDTLYRCRATFFEELF